MSDEANATKAGHRVVSKYRGRKCGAIRTQNQNVSWLRTYHLYALQSHNSRITPILSPHVLYMKNPSVPTNSRGKKKGIGENEITLYKFSARSPQQK